MIHIVTVNGDNWGLTEEIFKGLNIRDFDTIPGNRRKEVVAMKLVFRKFVALSTK